MIRIILALFVAFALSSPVEAACGSRLGHPVQRASNVVSRVLHWRPFGLLGRAASCGTAHSGCSGDSCPVEAK